MAIFSALAAGASAIFGGGGASSGAASLLGIASGVKGLFGSRKKRKRAKKARRRAQAIENHFLEISKTQKELFDKHGKPATERFFAEATEGVDPERHSEQAAADLDRSFTRGLRRRHRQLQSRGLNPGDPAFKAIEDQLHQARTVTEAGLRTSARERAKTLNLTRLASATDVAGRIADRSTSSASAPLSSSLTRHQRELQGEQDSLEGAGAGFGLALDRGGSAISNLFRGGSRERQLSGGSDLG